jgi:hypothetical protein
VSRKNRKTRNVKYGHVRLTLQGAAARCRQTEVDCVMAHAGL